MQSIINNTSIDGVLSPLGGLLERAIYNPQPTLAAIAALFLVRYTASRFEAAYFSPLSKYPGPSFLYFNQWTFKIQQARGKMHERLNSLHEKYGDIVRLGESSVVVFDKNMIREILVTQDVPKGLTYENIREHHDSPNLFNMTDKSAHKVRRRLLSPAFALSYISSIEPLINASSLKLIERLQQEYSENGDKTVVDIWNLLARMALDAIGDTAFGGSFEMVSGNNHPLPGKITDELKKAAVRSQFPLIKNLIGANMDPYIYNFVMDIIKARRDAGEAGRRKDILQILLDTQNNEENGLTDMQIILESVLFLIAGAETTSNTTSFAIIYLLYNPECLRRLQKELDEEFPDSNSINHDVLKNLPYLNAVINEAMRLRPVTLGGIIRECKEDTVIGGNFFPKGTSLIADWSALHTDKRYWGEDVLEFNPDRFLPDRTYPSDAFYPFSAGTRNCIGKNFAMMEMRLSLAHLFKNFDLEAVPGQSLEVRQAITVQLEQGKFDVKLKPRKL